MTIYGTVDHDYGGRSYSAPSMHSQSGGGIPLAMCSRALAAPFAPRRTDSCSRPLVCHNPSTARAPLNGDMFVNIIFVIY